MSRVRPGDHAARGRLVRLADWARVHRWRAVGLWVVLLVAVAVGSSGVGTDYRDDHTLPGTESQAAIDLLGDHGSAQAGDNLQVVLRAPGGVDDPAVRDRVDAALGVIAELPHVAAVVSPYDDQSAVSADGTIAYATVALDGTSESVPADAVRTIIDAAQAADREGLQVEVGGDAVREAEAGGGGAAEGAGMLAALVILCFMFGSIVAAGLPLLTAIFAVGTTLGIVEIASNLVEIASYTAPVLMLVGLGVGIDYALLIFSRYRGELLGGANRDQAARTALDTAGRSVLLAGCTVVIALLGLFTLGLGSLQGVALGVSLTVLVTMAASVTLLPALLAIAGPRIERSVRRRASRAKRGHGDGWRRWARLVQRHPRRSLVAAVVVLLALAAPVTDMRLGFADASNDPPATTSRQAYDLLADGFGPGFNGPLIVVSDGADDAQVAAMREALRAADGVARVVPIDGAADATVTTTLVMPDARPQDEATSELVTRLRDETLPPLTAGGDAGFLVGGATAAADDFSAAVAERLPLFVAVVVGLSALLLLVVFRSVWIPIKAAILNLLSIGAALGVITLVFQEGLLGAQPGPVEAFVPVMIFAIVFGLSMDYEVFLLSRMREEWLRSRDPDVAVREGLATTGGVITAAAAIMIVVFGAFVLSPDRMLQQFGLGLAVAILLDALVIRCLVVPAVMRLLGVRAWWLPRGLDRRLPHVEVERPVAGEAP
jgi:RND superfamily putative drug exporter